MILDTHLHIWDPDALDYGWLTPHLSSLYRRFDLDQARRASDRSEVATALGGISGVILVQAADAIAESRYLLDQAADQEWVRGVVGWLPLRSPEAVRRELSEWAQRDLVGVRHLTHDDPDHQFLTRTHVLDSLRVLAQAGLPLDVPDSFPVQLAQIPQVAAVVPDLRIVIDHLGKPPVGGDLGHWRDLLGRAAAHEGVYAKVSGLATSLADGATWDPSTLRPVLDIALEAFGPHRLMVGSDWPIADPTGDYASSIDPILGVVGALSADEREAVLARTARTVYGV